MQKLKVTWQGGAWDSVETQPLATRNLDAGVRMVLVGETLVFKTKIGDAILLAVPESRLVSADLVTVEGDAS